MIQLPLHDQMFARFARPCKIFCLQSWQACKIGTTCKLWQDCFARLTKFWQNCLQSCTSLQICKIWQNDCTVQTLHRAKFARNCQGFCLPTRSETDVCFEYDLCDIIGRETLKYFTIDIKQVCDTQYFTFVTNKNYKWKKNANKNKRTCKKNTLKIYCKDWMEMNVYRQMFVN